MGRRCDEQKKRYLKVRTIARMRTEQVGGIIQSEAQFRDRKDTKVSSCSCVPILGCHNAHLFNASSRTTSLGRICLLLLCQSLRLLCMFLLSVWHVYAQYILDPWHVRSTMQISFESVSFGSSVNTEGGINMSDNSNFTTTLPRANLI